MPFCMYMCIVLCYILLLLLSVWNFHLGAVMKHVLQHAVLYLCCTHRVLPFTFNRLRLFCVLACSGSSTEYRKSWTVRSCGQEPAANLICDVAYFGVTSKPVAVCIWATSPHCTSQSLAIQSKQSQHVNSIRLFFIFYYICWSYIFTIIR